jgi:hypothetical protein
MQVYETSAMVEEQGQVRLAGVPFAPGTEVQITINPLVRAENGVTSPDEQALATARQRMRELFRTVKGFRNSPRIPREELHERGSLH